MLLLIFMAGDKVSGCNKNDTVTLYRPIKMSPRRVADESHPEEMQG